MSSQGPLFPGTAANDASYGTGADPAWGTPNNAKTNDLLFSICSPLGLSNYLKLTNYGFTIPTGATIDGIVLEISRKANVSSSITTGSRIMDDTVKLVKGGTVSGTNKALTGTANRWPTGEAIATYGSSSDLWGLTWTDTDINASNFGAVLAVVDNRGDGSETGSVNFFRITVYYTASGGGGSQSVTGFGIAGINFQISSDVFTPQNNPAAITIGNITFTATP
jgi:hypothetical protein